jgi:hypothetical protein
MSNTTLTTTSDGDVLTMRIRSAQAKTVLSDRLYALMSASTTSPSRTEHDLSVMIDEGDGDINLHFQHVYISMSQADWDRVVDAVAEARAIAAGIDR